VPKSTGLQKNQIVNQNIDIEIQLVFNTFNENDYYEFGPVYHSGIFKFFQIGCIV